MGALLISALRWESKAEELLGYEDSLIYIENCSPVKDTVKPCLKKTNKQQQEQRKRPNTEKFNDLFLVKLDIQLR